jgi:penicillin-binding protein 1C
MPGRSGRLTAAPILFKIADLLGPAGTAAGRQAPPAGVLLVTQKDLPPGLRRLAPGPLDHFPKADSGAPKILYPPDGSVVVWDGQDIPLEANSGRGGLRWLIDGRPLPPGQPRRTVYWRPTEVGFTRLTVLDANGRSASATIRLVR